MASILSISTAPPCAKISTTTYLPSLPLTTRVHFSSSSSSSRLSSAISGFPSSSIPSRRVLPPVFATAAEFAEPEKITDSEAGGNAEPEVNQLAAPFEIPRGEEVFAVVMVGSRQYIVFPGRFLYVQRLKDANENDKDLVMGRKIEIGLVSDGLYRLPVHVVSALMTAVKNKKRSSEAVILSILKWHEQLGHIPFRVLRVLFPVLFSQVDVDMISCDVCQCVKHVRVSYLVSDTWSDSLFSLIHSDVCGPSGVSSYLGFEYFITFIDDFSRNTFVYMLKDRSEVPHMI